MHPFRIVRTIFFLTCLEISFQGMAQDLSATIGFAETSLTRGEFTTGIGAYKRAVYFAPDSMLCLLYTRLGEAYEEHRDFQQAEYFYNRAYESAKTESQAMEYAFRGIRCNIEQEDWLEALSNVYQVPENLPYELERRRQFYFAMIHFGMGDFEASRKCFILSLDTMALKDSVRINEIFFDEHRFDRPNPKSAQIMSMFLPGLGQLYSGDLKNAANSLVLTSGLAVIAFYVTAKQGPVNAIFTIMPWFQRYYTGGFSNAKLIAEERRAEKRHEAMKDVMVILAEHPSH